MEQTRSESGLSCSVIPGLWSHCIFQSYTAILPTSLSYIVLWD